MAAQGPNRGGRSKRKPPRSGSRPKKKGGPKSRSGAGRGATPEEARRARRREREERLPDGVPRDRWGSVARRGASEVVEPGEGSASAQWRAAVDAAGEREGRAAERQGYQVERVRDEAEEAVERGATAPTLEAPRIDTDEIGHAQPMVNL